MSRLFALATISVRARTSKPSGEARRASKMVRARSAPAEQRFGLGVGVRVTEDAQGIGDRDKIAPAGFDLTLKLRYPDADIVLFGL